VVPRLIGERAEAGDGSRHCFDVGGAEWWMMDQKERYRRHATLCYEIAAAMTRERAASMTRLGDTYAALAVDTDQPQTRQGNARDFELAESGSLKCSEPRIDAAAPFVSQAFPHGYRPRDTGRCRDGTCSSC
jgi:hypothetical protein